MNFLFHFLIRWFLTCLLILYLIGPSYTSTEYEQNLPIYETINKINANVIFLRHTLAPGIGDPKNFKLNDCSTQRNLDRVGRRQAEELGSLFRQNKVNFDEILSSEWCRCKETAALMQLGQWETFLGLNSFFEGYVNKKETLRLLNQKLALIKSDKLVLMITHQVVISAVTGKFVGSGEMVFYNSETGISEYFKRQK